MPGGPGTTWSAILMLSVGPRCCKHPYATLLQGLWVANNHGHLLAWHWAQAQCPGNRARQRLVRRHAPETRQGASSSAGPLGEQENKRQISLSLKKKLKRSISLKTQHKTGAGEETESLWGPEYSQASFAQLKVLGGAEALRACSMLKASFESLHFFKEMPFSRHPTWPSC